MPPRPAAPPPAEVQTPVQQSPEVRTPEVQSPEVRSPRGRRRSPGRPAVTETRAPVASPGLPKYLRLERKELLIWPEQITNLSILARVLNRNRGGAGERITTNTLIRVAASLLLSRSQDLAGTTEEELRRSLGLPDLRSPDVRSLCQRPGSGGLTRGAGNNGARKHVRMCYHRYGWGMRPMPTFTQVPAGHRGGRLLLRQPPVASAQQGACPRPRGPRPRHACPQPEGRAS